MIEYYCWYPYWIVPIPAARSYGNVNVIVNPDAEQATLQTRFEPVRNALLLSYYDGKVIFKNPPLGK